ncbi:MAG: cation diffusion facilitator family transporter [Candidatus Azotimanducaceae bacterium]|jgi:cation diffusion facilitator family transporter
MTPKKNETQNLLVLSGFIDLGLGIVKVLIGMFSGSYALIVDGIHSLTDLVTDVMVWAFNAIGSTDPDDDHPYGHAKFETFGTLILGCILMLLAAFLVYDTSTRLLEVDSYTVPTWPALIAAILSIAIKEWLYQVTLKLGVKTRSKLLQANAWHHRTDAVSSVLVFVGVGAAMIGFPWLELLAAIGVSLMIAMIGWTLAKDSVAELVDTALSNSYVEDIKQKINDVEGVRGVHSIRTRQMGADAYVDIHLQVDSSISVSEGHQIGEWVTKSLVDSFSEVNDVIFHIDAEDDEHYDQSDSNDLAPLRREVKSQLYSAWHSILTDDQILKMNLHYLENKIQIEVFLKNSEDGMLLRLTSATEHLPWLEKITLWYKE